MDIDLATSVSYASLVPAQAIAANTNSGSVNLLDFIGKVAIVIQVGVGTGTTPVLNGYFISSANSNLANGTNVTVLSQFTITTSNQSNTTNINTPATTGLGTYTFGIQNIGATNNTNQTLVFGLDQRAVGQYIGFIPTITGTNSPTIPVSIAVVGRKRVETT